ncbi:uncharacterized protein [Venturia canescens]|uniref:uncharacterized protein n=1 Tax=Venturia canescens TaxID=32260 RepID=UPI001C9CC5E8|nr:uncharacterized protein LOC122408271 [Venturia canescens]
MDVAKGSVNKSIATAADDVSWHTTQESLTQEEEDAIISLTVVAICVVVAIVILFSMGVFIDCREQKKDGMKRKRLRLKMPPLSRRKQRNEDGKSLASEMCPNGDSDLTTNPSSRVATV